MRANGTACGRFFTALLFALLASLFSVDPAHAQTTTSYSNTSGSTINTGLFGSCISRNFAVGSNIVIGDIDIGVLATTATRSQISATLTSPVGTAITLLDNDGGNADNLNTRFDGAAAMSITTNAANHNTAAAPYEFTLRPEGALSSVANQNAAGIWTLQFCLNAALSSATFTRSDLYITSIAQTASDLSLAKTVSNPFPPNGSANSYTLTLSNATGWASTANVAVREILPTGATFVSASTASGSYNNGTGIWTVPTIASGSSATLTISFTVNATPGAVITNASEVISSPNFDIDSTPNDGTGDDYATVSFTVAGTRLAGTPPTLTCPVGAVLLDWNSHPWVSGSPTGTATLLGIGTVGFAVATQGSFTLPLNTTSDILGGEVAGQLSLYQNIEYANRTQTTTTTITLPTAVPGVQFTVFDVDYAANDFADKLTVVGSFNGSPVTPTLTNNVANYVSGNVVIGDVTADNATANGNVIITFSAPVDTITITYGNHSTAPADPYGQAIAIYDFNFCRPQANLNVTKISSVLTDNVSATNPKAIPGAVVRYCIQISNPGSATATGVAIADPMPTTVTYAPGTMFSGTDCLTATSIEDENATGADESDPFGASITGTTLTGIVASLAPSATFALVFSATIN